MTATNLQPAYNGSVGTYNPDNLIGGDAVNAVTESIIVDTGNLVRGSVLGKITATGKYVLSASAASDGSQTPVAILAEDANATSGDVVTVAYLTGEFNGTALTLGAGHTLASVTPLLRDAGIFVKTNLAF
jgi:hypothetical protein